MTSEDVLSLSLRKSHLESFEIAARKQDEISLEYRDFSAEVFCVDLEHLPQAKALIREFREKIAVMMRKGKPREVYQLSVQLFPLTVLDSKGTEK